MGIHSLMKIVMESWEDSFMKCFPQEYNYICMFKKYEEKGNIKFFGYSCKPSAKEAEKDRS